MDEKRVTDSSEVEAAFAEARDVEPRLTPNEGEERPHNFKKKKDDLETEVDRLKDLGEERWTEYQVLSLNQMLVDFLKVDDLIATAQLRLGNLKDYAGDDARPYDWESYFGWKNKIEDAIDRIHQVQEQQGNAHSIQRRRDDEAEGLRAELRALLEHVAGYEAVWADGSVMMDAIMIWGSVAIFVVLVMGLLPVFHPAGDKALGILNWGFLGIVGALTAVLVNLRKSNLVAVGEMAGKKELWRTILSVPLGMIAGVIGYSLIMSGLWSGSAMPDLRLGAADQWQNIASSVVWGFVSGFSFEQIFDRVLGSTVGRGQ